MKTRVRKFKTVGAIFSTLDSIFSPQNAPDAFSAPIGKLEKNTPKKPPFSPKSASSGGHLFWPPPARADYCVCKLSCRLETRVWFICLLSHTEFFSPWNLRNGQWKENENTPCRGHICCQRNFAARPTETNFGEIDIVPFVTSISEWCSSK